MFYVASGKDGQSTTIRIYAGDSYSTAADNTWGIATTTIKTKDVPPTVTVRSTSAPTHADPILLSSLVVVTPNNSGDDPNLFTYTLTDSYAAKIGGANAQGGFFTYDGANPVNVAGQALTAAQFASLKFENAGSAGVDTLTLTVSDGQKASARQTFTVTATNRLPVVTSNGDVTATWGTSLNMADLFTVADDKDGPRPLSFTIKDLTTGPGAGTLRLNGVAQPNGLALTVLTKDQLSLITYTPGTSDKPDRIQLIADDGLDKSSPATVIINNAPLPSVKVTNLYTELLTFAAAAYPAEIRQTDQISGVLFDALMTRWRPLTAADLGFAPNASDDTFVSAGRFQNGNAQAIVAVGNMTLGTSTAAVPTLVIAYRGTDFDTGGAELRSDALDWPTPILSAAGGDPTYDSYWNKFTDLQKALVTYILAQGIKEVLISGHSLGGTAAQQALSSLRAALPNVDIEVVTDGSPGTFAGSASQPIVMVQNTGDLVPKAGGLGGNGKGGKILNITYAEDTSQFSTALHDKFLYLDSVDRISSFLASHPGETDFLSSTPAQAAAGPTYVVLGGTRDSWKTGAAINPPHDVVGHPSDRKNNELLIGTAGKDVIVGSGGSDHLYGNGGSDTFVLLDGAPVAYGNAGADKFYVVLGCNATIDETGASSGADEIDFCSLVIGLTSSLTKDVTKSLATLDPSTVLYRKDGSDLVLSISTAFGSTTTLRLKGLGTPGAADERLVFDVKTTNGFDTKVFLVSALWASATATNQALPNPPTSSAHSTATANLDLTTLTGFSSKLTVSGAANQQLDASPVHIQQASLTLDSADPAGMVINHGSNNLGLSSNGRYALFSDAIGDVSYGLPAWTKQAIFSKDLMTGTVSVLTTNASGTPLAIGGSLSGNPIQGKLSNDGQFLAFKANPSDAGYPTKFPTGLYIYDGQTKTSTPVYSYYDQIFVKDLKTGAITPVTVDTFGAELQADYVFLESFSASGRLVAFTAESRSISQSLVAGTDDLSSHLYVRDISTGTTKLVSGLYGASGFSADGHYLVGGGTVGTLSGVLVADLWNGGTVAVSTAQDGSQANAWAGNGQMTSDGQTVVFQSPATNLVPGVTDGKTHIYSKDLMSGQVVLVDEGLSGNTDRPAMSADGRFVTFFEQTGTLPSPYPWLQGLATFDLYVSDLATGRLVDLGPVGTERFSDTYSQGNITSSISADGTMIAINYAPTRDSDGASSAVNEYTISNPLYTATVHWRPTVVVTDQQISAGYTVSGASLFSASDQSGYELITDFRITDTGGSGFFSLDGIRQATSFHISPSQLSGLTYTAGAAGTVDTITVSATDGESWSRSGTFQAASVPLTVPELRDESLSPDLRDGNGDSSRASFSRDGHYLVFGSQASNLVPGDTNNQADIFLRDLQSGSTRRISLNPDGSQADQFSFHPTIAADGWTVAYESWATDAGTDSARNVFIWTAASGSSARVSLGMGGASPDGDSFGPTLSDDGNAVAFVSTATNLVMGDTNGAADIFLRLLQQGTTVRASTTASGAQADDVSWSPILSSDGARVFFNSYADNLVSGDTNHAADVFEKSLSSGAIRRISTDTAGAQANSASYVRDVTPDGRYVLLDSWADNLVAGDTNKVGDVFVKDTVTGVVSLVSQTQAGLQGNEASRGGWISDDGRFAVFETLATNFSATDSAATVHAYVKDLATGRLSEVSHTIVGATLRSDASVAGFSGDGRFIAFTSSQVGTTFDKTDPHSDVFTLPNPLYFDTPVVIAANATVPRGTVISAANLFSVSVGISGTVAQVQIYEQAGAADQGYFTLRGNRLPAGQYDLLQASELGQLAFVSSSANDHSVRDSLSIRAYDGTNWGEWTNVSVQTQYYGPPDIIVSNIEVQRGFAVVGPSLLSVSDAYGRSVQTIEIEQVAGTSRSGTLFYEGKAVAAGTALDVTPDHLSAVTFQAANAAGTKVADTLQVRASDGQTWSGWQTLTVTADPGNTAPLAIVSNATLLREQKVGLDSLVRVSDLNGDPITRYQIESPNSDATKGSVLLGGQFVTLGSDTGGLPIVLDLSAVDADRLSFVAGTTDASVEYTIRAFDGTGWSDWKTVSVTTSLADVSTVASVHDQVAKERTSISAGLLLSTEDGNGDQLVQVEVAAGAGSKGTWTLAGQPVPLTDGKLVVDAAQLSQLAYRTGTAPDGSAVTDVIQIRASDGHSWGAWSSGTVTSIPGNTAPTVAVHPLSVGTGQRIDAGTSLEFGDANGDPIVAYQVQQTGSDPASAHWVLSGQTITDQQLTSDQFGTLQVAGAGTSRIDTLSVRAFDGTDWSAWADFSVQTVQGATPAVVTVYPLTLLAGMSGALADVVSAVDPNNDAVTAFQVYDPDQGPGSVTLLNGQTVVTASTRDHPLTVSDLSDLTIQAASTARSDDIFVRAFSGAVWSDWVDVAVSTASPPNLPSPLFGTVTRDTHSAGGEVYALYEGLLGRAPDILGLEFWADQFDHGASPANLAAGFLASPEGQARLGASDDAGFVNQLYQNTLGRTGDAGGFTYWTNQLAHGTSRVDVADSFVFSSEFTASVQQALGPGLFVPDAQASDVARLYYGILSRAPDAGGLQGNTHSVEAGASLHDVAQGFLTSDEYRLAGTVAVDTKYVAELYQDVLGRAGSAAEVKAWTDAIAHGTDRVSVAAAFVNSAEFQAHYADQGNAAYIQALYTHVLERAADPAGVQGWAERLDSGAYSRADAAREFVSSLEFSVTHIVGSDGAFVDSLYSDLLGRHADPVGLGAWTDAIAHGADRAGVADALVQSSEFQAQYASQSSASYIQALYEHVLDRAGDAAGIQGWTDRLDNQGVSRLEAAHTFVTSSEFALTHISGSNATFVDELYVNTMGRHADPAGLGGWSDALAHGATRADVAVAIAESVEAQQHLVSQIEQGWHLA